MSNKTIKEKYVLEFTGDTKDIEKVWSKTQKEAAATGVHISRSFDNSFKKAGKSMSTFKAMFLANMATMATKATINFAITGVKSSISAITGFYKESSKLAAFQEAAEHELGMALKAREISLSSDLCFCFHF